MRWISAWPAVMSHGGYSSGRCDQSFPWGKLGDPALETEPHRNATRRCSFRPIQRLEDLDQRIQHCGGG